MNGVNGTALQADSMEARAARYRATAGDKDDDPHYREMLKYQEVPGSWYAAMLVVRAAVALAVVYATHAMLPWWGFLISLALAALSTLFFGVLYAISGLQLIIQPFVQMIGDSCISAARWRICTLCSSRTIASTRHSFYSCDLKIAQYAKLAPRAAFAAQSVGTLVGVVLNFMLMNNNHRAILLSVEGTNVWSGRQPQQYNSQAVAWGGLAHELFAAGKRDQWAPWTYVVGLAGFFPKCAAKTP